MTPEAIIRRLEGSFDDPGLRSSSRGDHDLNPGTRPPDPLTPAAVLVPIVVRHGGPTVLFTQRTAHLEHHAGQVSFPGGHQEPEDASPNETALRETEEEVGLDRRHVAIVGRLDQYVTRTGFTVTPLVGLVTPPFRMSPDADEVAEVFEVPLDFLLDPANHKREHRLHKGARREFFAMPYGDYYIWGATAGMLMNLYDVLSRPTAEGTA